MRRSIFQCEWAGIRPWSGLLVLALGLLPVWVAGARQQRPPEQEEEVKPKNKKILDPDAAVPAPAPDRPAVDAAGTLAEAAQQARHPALKKLFRTLAVPHDLLILTSGQMSGRSHPIDLVPERVVPTELKAPLSVTLLDDQLKPGKPYNIQPGGLKSLDPYEVLALKEVRSFLDKGLHKLPEADPDYLSRYEQLQAAEVVLREVKRFHESARQTGQRKGDGWGDVGGVEEGSLHHELLKVLVEKLTDLVEAKQWDQALSLGRRMTDTYPLKEDQALIAGPLAELLRRALRDPLASGTKMREVRQHLRNLLERFPGNKDFKDLGKDLKEQAQELFDLAKKAIEKKDMQRAQDLLLQAEETWPQLPDLRTYRKDLNATYPILRVGVRDLPQLMSPAQACTDTEKRVVELLFESLFKASPDANGLVTYQPGLAQGREQVVSLARQFQLPRNTFWSNDVPLTGADVRSTVTLLRKGLGTGRPLAWGDLLEPVVLGGDPFRVTVSLNQGYLEPLSLMTFKILPQRGTLNGLDVDEEEFAKHPIGSGPFRFDKIDSDQGRSYARFLANLNYGSRPGKMNLPRIKEIRFYTYSDPIEAFQTPLQLDLLLDLTAEQRAQLQQNPPSRVTLAPALPCNRRVYFLAVNHRNVLLQNVELRRALAYAINREAILQVCFRSPQQGKEFHKALNGPFPARSWAIHPGLHNRQDKDSLDLHDADLAKGLSKQVHEKTNNRSLKLTLKYPAGDEQVKKAMDSIKNNVEGLTNITIEPVALEPHDLRKQVEGPAHDFELAYYHYDFPDETYCLWPLLGQRALPTLGNYMGYQNFQVDAELTRLRKLRDFEEVRKGTQNLHKNLLTPDMPLIPLWQLDPMLAYREALKTVPFDPWLVFTDIDKWRLEQR